MENNKILIISSILPNKEKKGATFITNRCEIMSMKADIKVLSFNNYPSKVLKKFKYKTSHKRNTMKFENFDWEFINEKISITKIILKKLCLKSYFLFKYNKLIKYIDNSYDIIQAHFAFPDGYLALMIKKKFKIPYVVTCHGSDIHTLTKNKRFKKYIIKALNNADKVFFVSEFLYKKAKECGFNGENYEITTNGIDSNVFYRHTNKQELLDKYNLNKKNKIIGFVGNLEYIKGADRLVEIFKKIEKLNENVEFIIVGDGTLKNKIFDELCECKKITFTGKLNQEDVAEYMNCMDYLIVPSRNEGQGNVILEAYACATEVIATECGGIPEIIRDKMYLVKNNENMIEEIFNIISNDKQYVLDEYSNKIIKKYSWNKIVEFEMEILNSIIKR